MYKSFNKILVFFGAVYSGIINEKLVPVIVMEWLKEFTELFKIDKIRIDT